MVFKNVWDALCDDPDEAEDLKKRSGYMLLIQARLYGQRNDGGDESKCCGLPINQVRDLMDGKLDKFSLPELTSIAKKIGITAKV